MKTLYRVGLIIGLTVIVLLIDYCTAGNGNSIMRYDDQDEIEFYALMGFEKSECDW